MLHPAQLADLVATLTRHGFAVGMHQTLAAARLLAQLERPAAAADLAPWLAPIFCSNPQQQRDFPVIYRQWLHAAPASAVPPEVRGEAPPQASPAANRAVAWKMPRAFSLSVAALAAATLLLYTAVDLYMTPAPVSDHPTMAAPPDRGADAVAKYDATTALAEPPPAAASAVILLTAGASLPLLAWLLVSLRRRGFLERHPGKQKHTALHVASSNIRVLSSWRLEVASLGRTLRRKVNVPTAELDVPATVASYCRHGMVSRLYFGSRQEPEYLVLVNRVSKYDHCARIAEELVRILRDDSGVHVHLYGYRDDLRRLHHQPRQGRPAQRGAEYLERLLGRYPQARILIFSDGNELISPLNGQAVAWLPMLLQQSQPMLITPRGKDRWSLREYLLHRAGLQIMALDTAGLAAMGAMLAMQGSGARMPYGGMQARPPIYLCDVIALLDTMPPPASQVAQIISSLHSDLGPRGYAWLCACAIYPEIHWGITLTMGHALLGAMDPVREAQALPRLLVMLSALPWLRHGYMPDWLRSELLDSMAPADAGLARQALATYLATVTRGEQGPPGADALRIGLLPRPTLPGDVLAGARALLRSPKKPAIREDRVYLRFMSGKRSGLAVAAGETIAQLFYQHGAMLGQPSKIPYVMASLALGVCAVFLAPHAARKTDEPVITRPAPSVADVAAKVQPVTLPVTPPEITPADVRFSSRLTGGRTSYGAEYNFRFWLAASAESLAQVREVDYFLDEKTFKKKHYVSSDPASGFSQSYKGWGCLNFITLTITYKTDTRKTFDVEMCAALDKTPVSAK